jgi:hypothetical protein
VKTTLFAATLVVALTLSAAAQKKPAVSRHLAGSDHQAAGWTGTAVPPALCNPCLFYGGDINTADFNAAGMSEENTLLIPNSATYGNFNVPSGSTVTITGMLVNIQASANFDPVTATYDIRSGVTEGDGGTDIATNTVTATVAATGRNFIGLNEYTVAVNLSTPVVLGPGAYWVAVTPTCTNGGLDGSCFEGRFFVSNTTTKANNVHGGQESEHQMYLNAAFFGLTFANWCDADVADFNQAQCNSLSFGLMGSSSN